MHDEPRDCEPARADDDLVVRARTDRASLGLLYDRYYPRVVHYCLRRLFDRSLAEDVTSEVFLHVAAHVHDFAGSTESDFRGWLFRIATNAVNAHLRQTRRRSELWQAAAVRGNLTKQTVAHDFDRLDWPVVYQAICELDEREQAIVMLRFFGECSYEEIAAVVESTPGAVRTALSRALAGIRGRLQPDACDRPRD